MRTRQDSIRTTLRTSTKGLRRAIRLGAAAALLPSLALFSTGASAGTIVGTDLMGANLHPADGDVLSGTFTNVGEFKIASGTTVSVDATVALSITANSIVIDGTLDASGAGQIGGAGGGVGNKCFDLFDPDTVNNGQDGDVSGAGGGGGEAGQFAFGAGGGGGGYGGVGGKGGDSKDHFANGTGSPGLGGAAFGSANSGSIAIGSGGGGGASFCENLNESFVAGAGGSGGGAVTLVANSIDVGITGVIDADGEDGESPVNPASGGGGGSGGGIFLSGDLAIEGFLTARGGNGGDGKFVLNAGTCHAGGGGGGGRIKLFGPLDSVPVVDVAGGNPGAPNCDVPEANGVPGTSPAMAGAIGTFTSNLPPTAMATGPASVGEGTIGVMLDGTGSNDPDMWPNPLSYTWTQESPAVPAITLNLSDPAKPTFTAPYVDGTTVFEFSLVVNDGIDDSDKAFVQVTVTNSNAPAVADAGDDFQIKPGAAATLDGSDSFDPESDPFSYKWTQTPGGAPVSLDPNDTVQNPTFAVPNAVGNVLKFLLEVDDGKETAIPSDGTDSSQPDTVAVTIVDNAAPIADAGGDVVEPEGQTGVMLDGSNSSDPDGDNISYAWLQTAGPGVTNLSGANTAKPTFDLPLVTGNTNVVFELTVTDDDSVNPKMATDEVVIGIDDEDSPPICLLAYPSVDTLWPPNHKLQSVEIKGILGQDDPISSVTVEIDSIYQDELVSGQGDGSTSPDARIEMDNVSGSEFVRLRAERAGGGNGRVYTIHFTASDGVVDCSNSVQVSVRHNRKKTAMDDGPNYDSTQP